MHLKKLGILGGEIPQEIAGINTDENVNPVSLTINKILFPSIIQQFTKRILLKFWVSVSRA